MIIINETNQNEIRGGQGAWTRCVLKYFSCYILLWWINNNVVVAVPEVNKYQVEVRSRVWSRASGGEKVLYRIYHIWEVSPPHHIISIALRYKKFSEQTLLFDAKSITTLTKQIISLRRYVGIVRAFVPVYR